MGVALGGDRRDVGTVFVFSDQIDSFALGARRGIEVTLGHVMAHEIGHLLLPARADLDGGIMTPDWDAAVLAKAFDGGLGFTSTQGALIRASLQRHVAIAVSQ
jgi:hypothetical protein